MGALSTINILFKADLKQYSKELQNSIRETQKFADNLKNSGRNMSLYVTAPIVAFGVDSVKAWNDSAKAVAQVEAGLKSTGNAVGFTSDQLQKMAADLQNNSLFDDDDVLKNVTAQLLTFTNIAGTQFSRTEQAALDLATRLDGDLKGAAIQLGKALNDPVANLSALSRSGIQFSASQKEVINSLVKTGKLAEAQNLILTELEKQYGGSAKAAADAGAGGITQLGNSVGDLMEDFGRIIYDGLRPFVEGLKTTVQYLQSLDDTTKGVVVGVLAFAAAVGPVLLGLGAVVSLVPTFLVGVKAMQDAYIAFSATLVANPVTALLVGMAAVVSISLLATSRLTSLTNAAKEFSDTMTKAAGSVAKEKAAGDLNLAMAKDLNLSYEQRNKNLDEFIARSPETLGFITLETLNTNAAREAIEKYNVALLKRAQVTAAQEKLVDVEKRLLDLQLANLEAVKPSAWQQLGNALLSTGNAALYASLQGQSLGKNLVEEDNNLTALRDNLLGFLKDNAKFAESQKVSAEATENLNGLHAGTIAYYEAQITKLQELQNTVATTSAAFSIYGARIDAIQKKIDAIKGKRVEITAIDVKSTVGTGEPENVKQMRLFREALVTTQNAAAEGSARFTEIQKEIDALDYQIKIELVGLDGVTTELKTLPNILTDAEVSLNNFKAATLEFNDSVSGAMSQFSATIISGFGEALGAITSGANASKAIFGVLAGGMADLLIQIGKIAIEIGLSLGAIKLALKTLNPVVAITAGVALVALGSYFKSQIKDAGAFADGGVVGGNSYWGDKLMARVNSGETILNTQQQKNALALMGGGGTDVNVTVGGSFEIDGNKLRLVLDRTDKRNNRNR